MTKNIHQNKEIRRAVKYALSLGWKIKQAGKSSHAWGRLMCPYHKRGGCKISIWSTPEVPENHAKQIMNAINRCDCEQLKWKINIIISH